MYVGFGCMWLFHQQAHYVLVALIVDREYLISQSSQVSWLQGFHGRVVDVNSLDMGTESGGRSSTSDGDVKSAHIEKPLLGDSTMRPRGGDGGTILFGTQIGEVEAR